MKLIAFYLPQFHEIPENNDAWGRGFTEWTNVKKSIPLFEGHNQPRVPYGDNYYNLLEDGTIEWQAGIAREYGIYGFCLYHYWFEGRMVLEKPVEKMLENKELDIHFCFSWANEPWTKTWHGAGGSKEILIPQTYGMEEEWKQHYEYFRRFFRDERYIKENGKPVIVIYRLKNIPRFNQMIKYWNECAKKDGFQGVYIISMNVCREHVDKSIWVNASVDFEPNRTKSELHKNAYSENIQKVDYSNVCEEMLSVSHEKGHYRTVFADYDDSPRRGKRAVVMQGATPQKFGNYLSRSIELSKKEGNEYVFINAWNEWGEGNYLEPDSKWGYQYLEEVRKANV